MTQSNSEFSSRFSDSDSEAVLNFDCSRGGRGGGGFFWVRDLKRENIKVFD